MDEAPTGAIQGDDVSLDAAQDGRSNMPALFHLVPHSSRSRAGLPA